MKKVLCLACLGLFTMALAGCGGDEKKEIPKQTPEQTADLKKQHEEAAKKMGGAPAGGAPAGGAPAGEGK
jgi:hypothetical protein